ncbi:MAG: hypothetical protein ACJAR2_003169 [Ilumatobacter sp.]|jgi:hypothetical protein
MTSEWRFVQMTKRFKPPIFATTKRGSTVWSLNIGEQERQLLARLLDELRGLLTSDDDPDTPVSPVLQRLFPVAYHDDVEKEAEYQRLMREELVASRLFQIDAVAGYLGLDDKQTLNEGQVIALMQSINAVRVVLGTLLDVGEDDEIGGVDDDEDLEAERQLYGFLSWLLEWTVRSFQT